MLNECSSELGGTIVLQFLNVTPSNRRNYCFSIPCSHRLCKLTASKIKRYLQKYHKKINLKGRQGRDDAIGYQSFIKSKLNAAQSFAYLWYLRNLTIF